MLHDLADYRSDRVTMLEAENAVLRAEVEDLRREFLGSDIALPLEWCLTATEERIVALLLRRARATKEQIALALRTADRDYDPTIVESHVCKARRKLASFAIIIGSARYQGYWLEEPGRTELRSRLKVAA